MVVTTEMAVTSCTEPIVIELQLEGGLRQIHDSIQKTSKVKNVWGHGLA
jgi:hypothetical protein